MAQLTTAERLAKVKTALGLSGTNYQDETLQFYIEEVIDELMESGVARVIAESAAAVGCIACGVNDLWNYSSGGVKHSEQFNRRLIQLSGAAESEPTPNMEIKLFAPSESDVSDFGWQTSIVGIFRILSSREFDVSDSENLYASAELADGTEVEGENTRTGSRRTIQVASGKYIYVMPRTTYVDGAFRENEGTTVITLPTPTCYESTVTIKTFDKVVE